MEKEGNEGDRKVAYRFMQKQSIFRTVDEVAPFLQGLILSYRGDFAVRKGEIVSCEMCIIRGIFCLTGAHSPLSDHVVPPSLS
jgi:hypothetical protein